MLRLACIYGALLKPASGFILLNPDSKALLHATEGAVEPLCLLMPS